LGLGLHVNARPTGKNCCFNFIVDINYEVKSMVFGNFYDGCLERRTVDSCGNSTSLKTPQYIKEGRLKPFFANNVDIPFARARRLKPCPRKATVCSGKQCSYFAVYRIYVKNNIFFRKARTEVPIFGKGVENKTRKISAGSGMNYSSVGAP